MKDNIEQVPYRIGYSFRNPAVVKAVTKTKKPFWYFKYAAQGPTQVRENMWKGGVLRRYPAHWRRAAKLNTVKGLGDIEERGTELPDFYELGAAPLATQQSSDSVVRGPFGELLNVAITGAKTVMEEQAKLEQTKAGIFPSINFPFFEEQGSTIATVAVVAVIGVGAYWFLSKK